MTTRALDHLRSVVERESGISLGPDKEELLKNRIRKRLKSLNLGSEEQYLEILETDHTGHELCELLDVVSTNHTYFYREPAHFERFKEVLKELAGTNKPEVKIWCAASSTGEEPYLLAMICDEVLKNSKTTAKILATDISIRVLQRATRGIYEKKQVEKLPQYYQEKYFKYAADNEHVEVIKEIKNAVHFKRFNLSKFPYPLNGPIDIIFCRNVMIYFDLRLRKQVISEFERLVPTDGWLFISHSENLLGIQHAFKAQSVGAYRKL